MRPVGLGIELPQAVALEGHIREFTRAERRKKLPGEVILPYLRADRGKIGSLHLLEHGGGDVGIAYRGAVDEADEFMRGRESDERLPVRDGGHRLPQEHMADHADEFKIDLSSFHMTPFW